jgi:predicted LPLAT superfamily acyltransferase
MDRILESFVAEFEHLVRQHPEQWFQFAPYWPDDAASDASVKDTRETTSEPSRARVG